MVAVLPTIYLPTICLRENEVWRGAGMMPDAGDMKPAPSPVAADAA